MCNMVFLITCIALIFLILTSFVDLIDYLDFLFSNLSVNVHYQFPSFFFYLFIWLCWVLVVAGRLLSCGSPAP